MKKLKKPPQGFDALMFSWVLFACSMLSLIFSLATYVNKETTALHILFSISLLLFLSSVLIAGNTLRNQAKLVSTIVSYINLKNSENVLILGSPKSKIATKIAEDFPSMQVTVFSYKPEPVLMSQKRNFYDGKKPSSNITTVYGKLADLPFSSNQFDTAIAAFCFSALSKASLRKTCFAEAVRVVKPLGTLTISDFKYTSEYMHIAGMFSLGNPSRSRIAIKAKRSLYIFKADKLKLL